MRTVRIILLSVFAGIALTMPAALARYNNDAIAQREVSIPLSKKGTINLYSVRERGHDSFEFTAINVEHPVKKKPVTGEVELQYKCGRLPYIGRLFVNKGNSDRLKVNCMILVTPRIIIQEE